MEKGITRIPIEDSIVYSDTEEFDSNESGQEMSPESSYEERKRKRWRKRRRKRYKRKSQVLSIMEWISLLLSTHYFDKLKSRTPSQEASPTPSQSSTRSKSSTASKSNQTPKTKSKSKSKSTSPISAKSTPVSATPTKTPVIEQAEVK